MYKGYFKNKKGELIRLTSGTKGIVGYSVYNVNTALSEIPMVIISEQELNRLKEHGLIFVGDKI